MGDNVSTIRKQQPNGVFTLKEGSGIALQMLQALQDVHEAGFIHRDVKPSNFVMPPDFSVGVGGHTCYILDFGLCRRHLSPDGTPLPMRSNAQFRGTTLYASLHGHQLLDLGRRDDMWSLLFVVIDMVLAGLPWKPFRNNRDQVSQLKHVYCSKGRVPPNLPVPLQRFMAHLHTLEYEDKPDYAYLRRCLEELASLPDAPLQSPAEHSPGQGHNRCRSTSFRPSMFTLSHSPARSASEYTAAPGTPFTVAPPMTPAVSDAQRSPSPTGTPLRQGTLDSFHLTPTPVIQPEQCLQR